MLLKDTWCLNLPHETFNLVRGLLELERILLKILLKGGQLSSRLLSCPFNTLMIRGLVTKEMIVAIILVQLENSICGVGWQEVLEDVVRNLFVLNRLASGLGHSLRHILARVPGRGGSKVLAYVLLWLRKHTGNPFSCVHDVDQRKLGAWLVDRDGNIGAVANRTGNSLSVKVLHEDAREIKDAFDRQAANIPFDLSLHIVDPVLCKFAIRVLGTVGGAAVDQLLQAFSHRNVRDHLALSELGVPTSSLSDGRDIDECSLGAMHRFLKRSLVIVIGRYDIDTFSLPHFGDRFGSIPCKGTDGVLLR